MRAVLITLVLSALALPAPAVGAASWSAGDSHPRYQHCDRTGHHCVWRRAYWIRCAGLFWLTPHPIRTTVAQRTERRWYGWCETHVPTFTAP